MSGEGPLDSLCNQDNVPYSKDLDRLIFPITVSLDRWRSEYAAGAGGIMLYHHPDIIRNQ